MKVIVQLDEEQTSFEPFGNHSGCPGRPEPCCQIRTSNPGPTTFAGSMTLGKLSNLSGPHLQNNRTSSRLAEVSGEFSGVMCTVLITTPDRISAQYVE